MEAAGAQAYRNVSRQTLRDKLIVEHLGFVRHVLGRVACDLPEHIDRENLESAGVLGLVEAAGQYDPDRGVAFTTFAYPRIRGAIVDELRRNCPVPQQILQHWARIRQASAQLPLPVTTEALSSATGLTVDEVETCLSAMRLTRIESWEDPETGNAEPESPAAPQEDTVRDQMEQQQLLADAIEALPKQMRLVIILYYNEQLRMKEIGAVLGLSESRISRIISAAEHRLRTFIHRQFSSSASL